MLFPLPESGFLGLDLLSEALAQSLFLLLELGVINTLGLAVTGLASLHLGLTIVLVVSFFGGRDEVKHVSTNEKGTEFAEVAVGFILD